MTDTNYRQAIKEFLIKNQEMMGGVTSVTTLLGETIDLNDMTDEQAQRAAEALFVVGTPTRLGALTKKK
jgi:hypothetical protein